MVIRQGCEVLARSLDELLRTARAAEEAVARLREGAVGAPSEPDVGARFAELAGTVSSALDDVSQRLHRIEGVLQELADLRRGCPAR